ncbi:MAG: GxxExxY protein [Verrucomicrobia bacterium]|nr:GxxExxY protein [Verrucomicrobiota bacterium]
MDENDVAKTIVDVAYHVHSALGPGLLETVYEVVLAHELRKRGLEVARQVPIPIVYDGLKFDEGFRADLVVGNLVIVELKSVDCLSAVHAKQLLTQLRLTKKRLGLLINFGAARLKDNIRRLANGLPKSPPEL